MGTETKLRMAGGTPQNADVEALVWTFRVKPGTPTSLVDFDAAGRSLFGIEEPTPAHGLHPLPSGVHPSDQLKLEQLKDKLATAGRASIQVRWKHPQGDYAGLRARLHLLRDNHGQPLEIVGRVTAVKPKAARLAVPPHGAGAPACAQPEPSLALLTTPAVGSLHPSMLRLLVEQSPIPMSILRLDGTVEYLNPTFDTTFGPNTRSARSVVDLVRLLAPDGATRDAVITFWRTELLRRAAAGESIPCRTRLMRNAQGEIRHVQIQTSVVQDRLLVVYSDVTALKQAEARLERLTRHASSLLVELSPDGQVLFANRHAEGDMLQVEAGQTIQTLNWPADLQQALAQTVASGAPVGIERSCLHPRHAPRHYQASFQPVTEDGRLRCVVLTLTDITERKAVDELLAMRTAALEATTDGIAITEASEDGCPIVYVDHAFEQLTGWQRSRALGRTCQEVLWADATRPQACDALHAALREGVPFEDEALLQRHDGSTFWSHLRILPYANAHHVITHHVWLVLDITEQKRREEELLAQQRELGRLGRLAMMGEVGAAYAHELAQPLSALVGNATAALTNTCTCPSGQCGNQEVLQDMLTSVDRLRSMFDRLRSLTRPSPCAREQVDLNAVVQEALALFRQDALACGVRVDARLHERLPQVWLDRVQMQQVLLNLLNNALDAVATVPAARRRIEVRTSPARHGAVCLAVRDQGTGIASHLLPQLFTRSLTTKAEGTGIGLRLCHRIIQAHQGTLHAENHPRHGATFRVLLPVAPLPAS